MIEFDEWRSAVAAVDPDEVDDADVGGVLLDLYRFGTAVDACWLRFVARLDSSELWRADGAPSAVAWLRGQLRITGHAATEALTTSRALAALPACAEAFRLGHISLAHVRAVIPAVAPARMRSIGTAEAIFARSATWLDPRQLGRAVRTWIQLSDDP
jgi:hypothetical protein